MLLKFPPNLLITTPESFALMMSYKDSRNYFACVKCLIIDELHNIIHTKRGDLLSLNISRLQTFAPDCNKIALSASIKDKKNALEYISNKKNSTVIEYKKKPNYDLAILKTKNFIPWSGHLASYAVADIYKKISNKTCFDWLFKKNIDVKSSTFRFDWHYWNVFLIYNF